MVFRATLLAVFVAVLGGGATLAQSPAVPPKAVVELFTSQGCSSCPAADALFTEMAGDPGVITLTYPVTYWDYLGWKDTLGQDSFTKRQKLYAKARGDGQIYTPQAVINGAAHVVGSDRPGIERAIADRDAKAFGVDVSLEAGADALQIRLTPRDGGSERKAGIWIVPTTRMVKVQIGRGENQGRTVSYANVARTMVRVGDWDGRQATVTAPLSATQATDADGYVVLVQSELPNRSGVLLGAARGLQK